MQNIATRGLQCCAAGLVFFATLGSGSTPAFADKIQTAGEILRIALPVAAGAYSLYLQDYDGTLQLVVSEVISEGLSFGLSHVIREQRPNGADFHSFPSDSAAVAFSAASFLQIRYGWGYGLPAYAVAGFVGWSRVESGRHYWHDVLVGAALGWVASEIAAVRYHNDPGTIGTAVPMSGAFAHRPL